MIPIVSIAERIHISAYIRSYRKSTKQTIMEAAPYPYYIIRLRFPIAWCELWKIRAMTEPGEIEKRGKRQWVDHNRCTLPLMYDTAKNQHHSPFSPGKLVDKVHSIRLSRILDAMVRCEMMLYNKSATSCRYGYHENDTVRHTNTNMERTSAG